MALGASAIIKHIQEQKELINTTAENARTAANEVQSATESLKNLTSEYENLGDRGSWDSDDYAQARDIQEEIIDLLKQQAGFDESKLNNIDLQNGKYEDQKKVLEDITAEQLRASKYALVENVTAQGNKLKETAKKAKSTTLLTDPTDEAIGVLGKAGYGSFNGDTNQFSFGSYNPKDINSILDYYDRLDAASKLLIDNMGSEKVASSGLSQWIIKTRDCLKDEVDAYRESTDAVEDNELAQRKLETARALTSTNARALNGALATLQSTIDGFDASKLVDLLNGINVELLTPDQQAALDKIREFMTVKGFTTEQIQAFVDVLVEIGRVSPSAADGVQSAAEAAQAAAEAFDDANKRIDNLQNAYQTMSTCVDEYNKNGWVTVDNLQALSQLEPQYLACLVKRDGQMSINTESVQKLAEAEIDLYRVSLLNNTIQGILATTSVEKANQILGQAKSDMSQSKQMLRDAKKQALQEAYEKYGSGDEFYAIRKAINQQIDSWENLDELWLDLKDKDPSTYLDKTSSASKSTSKSVSDAASAFDTLVSAMKEYNQYGYVSANTAKSLAGLEDKYTACLTKQNGKLVLNTAKFKDYIKQQIVAANTADDDGKSAYELAKILSYLNDSVDSETISFEQLTDAIKGYGTAMDEAKEKTDAIKSAFSDLAEVGQNKIDNPFGALDADNVDKKYQAIRNLYDNTDLFTNDKYAGALNPETGDIDYNSDAFKDMFLDSLDKMIAACKETGGAAGTYLAKGFEDEKNKIKNNVIGIEEFINGIGSTLSNINDRMDNFQSAFNDLSDIVDEYNTYGDLSQDNIQKFMALDPKYTACLELQGNKLVFNKEAFKALYIAELQELATKYEGTEAGKRYADILEKVDNGTWDVTNHMQGMNSEGEKLKTLFSDLSSLLSDFLGIFEKLNDTKSNDLKLWGEAMTEEIDKRIDALNEANDAQERSIELAKLQDEYEKAKANKTVHVYGGRGQGFVWKADDNAVHEAEQNLSDKRREYKLKDETDALNKLKDKYSEAMNLIGTDIDDYNKKLEYAAKIHNMSFEEMSDGVTSYKDSVIASLGAVNTVTDIKNTISNISSLISTLETLANVLNLLGGGSGNGGGIQGLFNQIKNMFTGEGGKFDLGGGFKKMFDGAAKVVSDGWNWITGKNRAGSAALRKDTTATLDILGNTIKVNTGDIQRVSGGFFERLVGSAKDNLGSIGKFFSKAWTSISEKTGLMFGDIGSFFTEGFGLLNSQTGIGLGGIVETVGSMFGPIAAGAQSIGSAISSGVVSFFPSIFAGLGTLVTSVGGAMAAMMQAIAAALASIPVAGWIAAAAAVAGAVALIATIASVASNVSNTQVDEPTPAFQAKKYAKGTRGVKKGQIANVDEKGEELIVRNPDQGRMTYLEKGDGVIPAKETDNLMAIGANPEGWLAKGLAEMTGSAAAGAGMSAKGPNAQLSGAAAAAAAGVGSVFKDEYDEILGDTNEFMSGLSDIFKKSDNPIIAAIQSMFYFVNKTAYRMSTVGKINSSKTVTESTSNTKKAAQSQISSMTSNFESSWKSVAGELGLDTKDIEATSKKMSEKMNELVNNTFDALNENTGLSAEQVEDVTNTMFDSLQKIYTSGWNSLASTSGDMSEEIAKKLNASYKSSVDSTNKAMNEISKAFGHSWNKVGGGVKTLSTNVQKTMEQAWADTSKDTQKLMYDMRACFDNSWSMNEAGVTNLADMTQGVVKDGYAEIDSSSSDTFGENGQLKTDADNSWKNVEPGATNLANNMQWVMDQSYNAIKAGCEAAVTSIKNDLATTGDAFEAVATKAEKAKQETQTTTTPKTETKKETDWSGTAAGAVIGSAFGPFGSLIGAGIGYLIHHASGVKSAKFPHMANVDEQGPEMLVRKPDSGRYTYLETGDGVVPADITSKLFEMGGNPDAWFQKQMAKYGSQPIVQGGGGDVTTSIGDIIITNPVGSSDALANEIKQKLPTKVAQMQSKR